MYIYIRCKYLGDGKSFLESELDIECFGSEHMKWAFSGGLINLVFWGLLVPGIIFFNLVKMAKKNNLYWPAS